MFYPPEKGSTLGLRFDSAGPRRLAQGRTVSLGLVGRREAKLSRRRDEIILLAEIAGNRPGIARFACARASTQPHALAQIETISWS
jgi:hypothetical protein